VAIDASQIRLPVFARLPGEALRVAVLVARQAGTLVGIGDVLDRRPFYVHAAWTVAGFTISVDLEQLLLLLLMALKASFLTNSLGGWRGLVDPLGFWGLGVAGRPRLSDELGACNNEHEGNEQTCQFPSVLAIGHYASPVHPLPRQRPPGAAWGSSSS